MKKEWTFNYFVKAEPDKNKAHVPEKQCGLNLWNSFIGNSMLIKKNRTHTEAHFSKKCREQFLNSIFWIDIYFSLQLFILKFRGCILYVWIPSLKVCIQTIQYWKNEYDFFELLDQLPTSTTYRKSVRHCGKAAHLLANDI